MAQMTLQRAAQVFNRVKAETAFAVEQSEDDYYPRRRAPKVKTTFTLMLSMSVDGPVRQQAQVYRSLVVAKKARMFSLMEIGTKIRGALATQQAKCGVTTLVTNRVMVTQKIKILEHLLGETETATLNLDLLVQQADVIKQRLSIATQGNTVANVSTSLLTADDRDDLSRELAALRSSLMGIDDELATLNATNHIEVNDEDLAVLREAGLAA